MQASGSVSELLEENGEYVDVQALTPARTWMRYGGPDAAPVTTDGPLPETSDLVAGWWMIDVESYERACEAAVEHSPVVRRACHALPRARPRHLRLVDLSVGDIEQLYAAMRQLGRSRSGDPSPMLARLLAARAVEERTRPLSTASIKRVHATLMSALNTAAKRRLIYFNPAARRARVGPQAEGRRVDARTRRHLAGDRRTAQGRRVDT
jgi:hypothetical protein